MRFNLIFILLLYSSLAAQNNSDWETITNMNEVRDLAADNEHVWVATSGGMYSYRLADGHISTFTNLEGLTHIALQAIAMDDHQHIIVGGKKGVLEIYQRESDSWYQLYSIEGSSISHIHYRNDTLWVAAGKGLAVFIFDGMVYKFKDYFKNFPALPNAVTRTARFAGRVWLGTDLGLLSAPSDLNRYTINDPALWELTDVGKGLPNNQILELMVIENRLWVGTATGLANIDAGGNVRIETAWGTASTDAANAIIVSDGKIFVASNNAQAWQYHAYQYEPGTGKTLFRAFDSPIVRFINDAKGNFWIGLSGHGLYNLYSRKFVRLDGPGQNAIRYVIRDSEKNIWASSSKYKLTPNEGFFFYDGIIWKHIDFLDFGWSDLGNTVAFFDDGRGNIWIPTWGGGLMVYRNGAFHYFHNYTNPGRMTISTKDTFMIQTLDPNPEIYRNFFSGVVTYLTYEVIGAVNMDNFGRLWVSNYYAANDNLIAVIPYTADGFISLNKNDWVFFGKNQQLIMFEGAVSCMAFDDFNRAWIGSFRDGLFVLDYSSRTSAVFVDRLTTNNNLYSNTILSIAKDRDGIIWIGTAAGLNSFDGVNIYKHVGDSEGLAGPLENRIHQIVVDKFNNKWFATSGGLSILRAGRSPWDETAWIGFTTQNSGLVDNEVHSVFVDSELSEALIATENGLSIYRGSFAQIRDDYETTIAGPNPFILGQGNSRFLVKNLRYNSTVKIFSLNGELIRELNSTNGFVDGSRAHWDGRDRAGNPVASGIYFYLAYSEDGKSITGKFAVLRK